MDDGWRQIKRGGIAALPGGDASTVSVRLLNGLREIGLFVVPVGELERWDTTVGVHGPAWVNALLEHGDGLPAPARAFVRELDESFSD